MAVVFMEGFDHLTAAQFITYKQWLLSAETNGSFTVTTGRYSGQALRWNHSGNSVSSGSTSFRRSVTYGPITSFSFQMNFRLSTFGNWNASEIIQLRTAAGARVGSVTLQSDGMFRLLNAAGTIVATGTNPYIVNTWVHLEVVGTVGTSNPIALYLNGSSTAECSATANLGSTGIGQVAHVKAWPSNGNSWSHSVDFDDMSLVDESTRQGERRVYTATLDAEGAETAWTANTGTKVDAIDQTTSTDNDTDYISSSTPGDRQTFTVTDLPASITSVYAVQTTVIGRKDDAGDRSVGDVVRVGSTNYDGPQVGVSTSYTGVTHLMPLDPTDTEWTPSSFNATEFGVTST